MQVEADVLDQVQRFLELLSIYPNPPILPFEVPEGVLDLVSSGDDVEAVAAVVRSAWGMGSGEISGLLDTFVEHGIVALATSGHNDIRFNGVTAEAGGYPVVVLGSDWARDRQRFFLAQELGGLLLAGRVRGKMKISVARDRFARAFLVPAETARRNIGDMRRHVEARELYLLKHRYGLSMRDSLIRLRDLGLLGPSAYKDATRLFSTRGWHSEKPGDPYAGEEARRFEQLVLRALSEEMITMSKAAELMALPLGRFRERLVFGGRRP